MSEKSPPDPFDPASLRLDQSFTEGAGVKKLLTTVPVRKPKSTGFRASTSWSGLSLDARRHHRIEG